MEQIREVPERFLDETIRHEDGGYTVYSKSGKRLSKKLKSRSAAERRLAQVEYFKSHKSSVDAYGDLFG